MYARRSLAACLALSFVALLSAGCAEGGSVGSTFTNLGGSGGNGTGGSTGGDAGAAGSTTSSTSSSSSSSSSTTSSSTTSSTTSTTATCQDTGAEPNDTEQTAKNLGTIDDCDGSGSSFSGVINGPSDVDWYKYFAQDAFGCQVGPSRSVQFMAAARICKFVECQDGSSPSVTCPAGTVGATSPEGRPGCCGSEGFDMDLDCSSISDDTIMYIRIDDPNGADCTPYTVDYHY